MAQAEGALRHHTFVHVLIEALQEAKLLNVVDSLKKKYPELNEKPKPTAPATTVSSPQQIVRRKSEAKPPILHIVVRILERVKSSVKTPDDALQYAKAKKTLFTTGIKGEDTRNILEQIESETKTIPDLIKVVKIVKTLESLQGIIVADVTAGSLVFHLQCTHLDGLAKLWFMYKCGDLDNLMHGCLASKESSQLSAEGNMTVKATISVDDFRKALLYILTKPAAKGLDRTTSRSADNLTLPPLSRPVDHSDMTGLDLAVVRRENQFSTGITDDDVSTLDLTVRQVQKALQRCRVKSQQQVQKQMEVRLKTLRGQYQMAKEDTEAMVCRLTRQITELKEKDEKAQRVLLNQKLEIQQLQVSSKAREAEIEDLLAVNTKLSNKLAMANIPELHDEVRRLREKDETTQKVLSEQKQEIQLLQDTNNAIEELTVENTKLSNELQRLREKEKTSKKDPSQQRPETQQSQETSKGMAAAEEEDTSSAKPTVEGRSLQGEAHEDQMRDYGLKPLPEGCTHHIMISYFWRQQTQVYKIKEHLGKVGYRVWMDMDDIEGDITTSKAKAINEAAIVLIAFSDDYANSEYCKREALVAQQHKKVIVPVKMTDYEPDDWLDPVIGGKLCIDFSSTQNYRDKLKQLEVQIQHKLAEREPEATEGAMSMEGLLGDWDRELSLEDLRDSRLKPLPEGCTHHIMISYFWRQQTQVSKIKKHLGKVGYRVWMDEVHMKGTLTSSTAEAINEAAIVLIAFSEDYLNSETCKREALLAQQQKKEIIPLKMTDYEPDDWLGLLLAGKLYIDFSSTQNYSDKLKQLEAQIQHKLAEREPEATEGAMSMEGLLGDWDRVLSLEDLMDFRLKPPPEGCTHHIMISYFWRQQTQVRQIKKHLSKVGYRVWMDEVDMEGTLTSSTAEAINEAAIVLIAFSEDYLNSETCKREALLAQQQKKEIIPLKMTDYKPDNWLGRLLLGKLIIDFSSTQNLRDKLKQLEVKIEHKLAERETK
ncbi:hypothetical protein Bbelb_304960 [Branchiostoma belcheri]|nr:hypothetical protein Bbelb_304960 [Branchiostoma belcheri]